MKKTGIKAQGAMEYLTTYSWAILVVLIVGVVLWNMNIFRMGTSSKGSAGFSRIKPLDHECMSPDTVSIVLINGVGAQITLNVSIGDDTQGYGVVAAGDKVTGTFNPSNLDFCSGGEDNYELDVNITYLNSITGSVSHESGSVWGPC